MNDEYIEAMDAVQKLVNSKLEEMIKNKNKTQLQSTSPILYALLNRWIVFTPFSNAEIKEMMEVRKQMEKVLGGP